MSAAEELERIAGLIDATGCNEWQARHEPRLLHVSSSYLADIAASLRAVAAGIESATAGDALGMLEKLAEAGSYCEADVIISAPCRGSAEWVVTNHDGKDGAGPTLRAAIRAAATGGEGA